MLVVADFVVVVVEVFVVQMRVVVVGLVDQK